MLYVSVLWAVAGSFLHGQDTAGDVVTGKVLLLRNGHALEGDIKKIGTRITIRRGISEVTLAADTAERICADWDDACAYLLTLIKPDSANDRVKIARWCYLNNLPAKAMEHARVALELQPDHKGAKQIVTVLERAPQTKAPETPAPAPVLPPRATEPATTVDVSAETLVTFSTRVQPILMNACAVCHSTGRGGNLHLERVSSPSQKAATLHNLAKVLTYIDLERPAISPLLTKAIMSHGAAQQPAIKGREARAFQTLHEWIEQTIARNPHMKDYAAAKKNTSSAKSPPSVKDKAPPAAAQAGEIVSRSMPRVDVGENQPLLVHSDTNAGATANPPPRNLPAAVTQTPMTMLPMTMPLNDPFDPDIFNQQMHSKQ